MIRESFAIWIICLVLAPLIAITGCGGGSSSAPQPALNPPPSITGLSPSVLAVGAPGTTITVTGTNFVAASKVNLNSAALATSFVSATQLNAVVPSNSLASASTGQVTVTTPSPGGGTSGPINLTVVALSSFVIMATPGGGPATGQWQIAVAAVDSQANPVANLPLSLKTTAGSISLSQGFTDTSGTLTATVSPPVPYSGEAVAVSATTGGQTAAVNIAFISSSSSNTSSSLPSRSSYLISSQTSSSTNQTFTSPLILGTSGSPGSANPFVNPNLCWTVNDLSTTPVAGCQPVYTQNGVEPSLLDLANTVCEAVSSAIGIVSCTGTGAVIYVCGKLLKSVPGVAGPLACGGAVVFVGAPLAPECLKYLAKKYVQEITKNPFLADEVDGHWCPIVTGASRSA